MSYSKTIALGMGTLFMMTGIGMAEELTMTLDSTILFESSSSCTEEAPLIVAQATEPSEPQSPRDVQERAVPRMAPGLMPGTAPATRLKGGVVNGNRLHADPGYVLDPLPGNKVALKPKGGGPTIEASCMCRTQGGCSWEVIGPSAYCKKSGSNACTSNCILTVGGKLSGGVMSIQ